MNIVRTEIEKVKYYIDDEEIARISGFCQAAEIDFQSLAGPRNVISQPFPVDIPFISRSRQGQTKSFSLQNAHKMES